LTYTFFYHFVVKYFPSEVVSAYTPRSMSSPPLSLPDFPFFNLLKIQTKKVSYKLVENSSRWQDKCSSINSSLLEIRAINQSIAKIDKEIAQKPQVSLSFLYALVFVFLESELYSTKTDKVGLYEKESALQEVQVINVSLCNPIHPCLGAGRGGRHYRQWGPRYHLCGHLVCVGRYEPLWPRQSLGPRWGNLHLADGFPACRHL
jgi:hypothetical protein